MIYVVTVPTAKIGMSCGHGYIDAGNSQALTSLGALASVNENGVKNQAMMYLHELKPVLAWEREARFSVRKLSQALP